jgi:Protein of unknown function (DUF664)
MTVQKSAEIRWPVPARTEAPYVSRERDSLESWLDYHRATLLLKCAGLTPEQLVIRSCEPSRMSLLGLVRHMAEVESWFHEFDDQPDEFLYYSEGSPEACFDDVDPARADTDLAAYQAAAERSRKAAAGRCLDDLIPDDGEPVSLRWVYQHMIEEYARHNGHADLLRERIDGVTGDLRRPVRPHPSR